MQYVIVLHDNSDDTPELHCGPVPNGDADYLRLALKNLTPLSDEHYVNGPAAILRTMANHSYVLDGSQLYWCIEWEPGLLIISMAPDGELKWVALRSPVPDFGGREPLPEDGDPDDYDDGDNPQYNLIFTPLDAQYDADERESGSFVPATEDFQNRFHAALAHVKSLGETIEQRHATDLEAWIGICQKNLRDWCGEGIRLKSGI
ncbi:MAG: hypothetical protein KDA91_14630 [Planctomycetaceae bacterium]|nr:hypothetical protein [Planctomycetaceae bacterium]